LNTRSEVYRETSDNIRFHLIHDAGKSSSNASRLTQSVILSDINRQAYIQGINDDFLIACFITLAGGIPILFMHTRKSKTEKRQIHE
jgi:MFS transporter, DHA2 family, multidrug resistance protein